MLVLEISINKRKIVSTIGAVRLYPETVHNDTICTYSIGRVHNGRIKNEICKITHKYGDGAEVLAKKMMDVITKRLEDKITPPEYNDISKIFNGR